jgi:hypothetical protein
MTEHNRMGRFPEAASQDLLAGPKRNSQMFDPLGFLAEVAQHIPIRESISFAITAGIPIRAEGCEPNHKENRRGPVQRDDRMPARTPSRPANAGRR